MDGPKGVLTPAGTMPKVVVYRRWKAKKVTEPKPGLFVADFGESFCFAVWNKEEIVPAPVASARFFRYCACAFASENYWVFAWFAISETML